ncbi:MAG: TIGR01777 family protein [Coleofasciculaceae cyanobacterium RL_1_1]|nr:TIGR01777 family protein [Coleofasciculaceae cyanobacterium RL_1_1]
MKVAIAGATGFVGQRLVQRLRQDNHSLVILTRELAHARSRFPSAEYPSLEIVPYTPKQSGDWQAKISGCDAVVNLAGAPIDRRWSPEWKHEIYESRQLTTRTLVEAIAKADEKPAVLVNASAIGYYGTSETETFDETSASGRDFLASVCEAWEQEASKVKECGTRLAILRLGIVLGNGGAISKMLMPFQMFAGGPIGSGQQWFSWVHIDDVVGLILAALTDDRYTGIYNATAPNPVRMSALCQTLGDVLNRPSWLPVPPFALELLLGEGAQVVLQGQQVLPRKTLETGFSYTYDSVKPALESIV